MINVRKTSPLYKAVIHVTENTRIYYNDLLLLLNSRMSRKRVLDAMKENDYIYHEKKFTCTLFAVDGKGYKRIVSIDPSSAFMVDAMTNYRYDEYRAALREQGTNEAARERTALSARCSVAASLIGARRLCNTAALQPLCYIPIKQIKSSVSEEDKRTRFSQMRGVFVSNYLAPIPMFSCSGLSGVVFHGFGEEKMLQAVRTAFPSYPHDLDTCIIVGDRYQAALDTLRTRKRYKFDGLSEERYERFNAARVTEVFNHIIFAPMDNEGINILKIFANDPAGRAVTRLLVPDADMYYGPLSIFEYDAKKEDQYYIQFLTGDIARMRRIAGMDEKNITIYCFPGQTEFLEKLFSSCDNQPEIIPLTKTEALMQALGIECYQRRKDC